MNDCCDSQRYVHEQDIFSLHDEEQCPTTSAFSREETQTVDKKRKKKLKQVVIRLDSSAHQRLMDVVSNQFGGSIEMFVSMSVDAKLGPERRPSVRKPSMSKWRRMKFEQLKSSDLRELAGAFRSLVESTSVADLPTELLDTPWHELTLAQFEKMLEETKKLLSSCAKSRDCPHEGCDKRFVTPGSLADHLNEHSGERPYACTFQGCALQFSSKQLLNRHIKQHERAFQCSFEGCNKRFAFRDRLVVHQKTHCDDRPLICPYEGCGKSFKWLNSLNGHKRTHTGEKPFQCTFAGCEKSFGYKVDLTRHLRTHFGQHARTRSR